MSRRAGSVVNRSCHAHLKNTAPRLLPAAASALSSRCHEIENRSGRSSTRTSLSVDEPLRCRKGKADPVSPTCASQMSWPYYSKYLENKINELQEHHMSMSMENASLKNQLSKAEARNQDLEEKFVKLEDALLREKRARESPRPAVARQQCSERGVNTIMSALGATLETGTSTESPKLFECSVQTVLEQSSTTDCEVGDDVQLISISKAELESLEKDMRILRDAVRAKEDMWNQAVERDQNYQDNLTQLSMELMTIREQSESRFSKLKILGQKLVEKDEELKLVQKEFNLAKKTILKYQKRYRTEKDGNNEEPQNQNPADNQEPRDQPQKVIESKPVSQPQSPVARNKIRAATGKDRRSSSGGNSPRTENFVQRIKEKENDVGS